MTERSIGDWMRSFYYGRPISSRPARTAAQYYRIIIHVFVIVLLMLHLVYLFVLPPERPGVLIALVGAAIILYLLYAWAFAHLPFATEKRYYTSTGQMITAQVGMVGTATLVFSYAVFGQPHLLWPHK